MSTTSTTRPAAAPKTPSAPPARTRAPTAFFANASNASSFLPGASAALSSTHDMLSNITGSTSRSEALVNSYASSFQPGHLVEPMPVPVPSAAYAPVTPTSALHSNAHRASMISPKHNSFLSADKRKGGKKANKVISTIKSNRAKPAKTIECKEVPRKETRVKGAVYKIGEERKKWDGRQWRRLCIVEDCCSAARGATDFCIVHGRGEVTRQIVNNEEIEVVTNASRPLVAAVVAPRPSPSDLLQRKRKLDDSQDTGPLRRTMKRFDRSTLESKDDAQHGRGYSVPQISW
mmetsp:Transcript_6942/g.19535  ORF Transcript_6942/g.19535 Transcript_6942/m.19535 type:complete len:290 (-) Transcript_6942:323-1192(-)